MASRRALTKILALVLWAAALGGCRDTTPAPAWMASLQAALDKYDARLGGEWQEAGVWGGRARALKLVTPSAEIDLEDVRFSVGVAFGRMPLTFVPEILIHVRKATATPARAPEKAASPRPREATQTPAPGSLWRSLARRFPVQVDVIIDQAVAAGAEKGAPAMKPAKILARATLGLRGVQVEGFAAQGAARAYGHFVKQGDGIEGAALVYALSAREILPLVSPKSRVSAGDLNASISFVRNDDEWLAKFAGNAAGVCLEEHLLGDGKACGIGVGFAGRVGVSASEIYVEQARVRAQGVEAFLTARVPREASNAGEDETKMLTATLRVAPQPVETVLKSIPKEWRTGLFDFDIGGDFSAKLLVVGTRDDLSIKPEFHFDRVEVKKAPAGQDPRLLRGPVSWTLTFPYGVPRKAHLSADDPAFVPIGVLSQTLIDAVRMSEDATFFYHDGFDRTEITRALLDIKDSAQFRGASTITQQLAKNLYFDGDRNLSRKIEEAVMTAALEASVPKTRLLEIYLNVVEWGDGVYGIGPAAAHYFGKAASALSPREAMFLAGILPAPRKVDRELRRDQRSPWAEKRLQRVSRFLCDVGKLPENLCVFEDGQITTVLASALGQ